MNLFDEFSSIIRKFQNSQIVYSVIGGVAMAFYDQPRFTRDMDFLVATDQMGKVKKLLGSIGYFESSDPLVFRNGSLILHRFMKVEGEDHIIVDILLSNEQRYEEILKNSLDEKWSKGMVRIASKEDIIWMKQQRNSEQDKVDIGRLINDKNGKGN